MVEIKRTISLKESPWNFHFLFHLSTALEQKAATAAAAVEVKNGIETEKKFRSKSGLGGVFVFCVFAITSVFAPAIPRVILPDQLE